MASSATTTPAKRHPSFHHHSSSFSVNPFQPSLHASDFSTKFNSQTFISELTHQAITVQGLSEKSEFNPEPFLQVFENSLETLQKLRKTIEVQIEDAQDASIDAYSEHKGQLADINRRFREVHESYNRLETPFTEGGTQIIRIGEQLESFERQRAIATRSKDIVQYFREFNSGKLSPIFSDDAKIHEVAKIMKQLQTIAHEADSIYTHEATTKINEYCKNIVHRLLKQMLQAFQSKNKDISTLKQCALTLYEFNGGHESVKQFLENCDVLQCPPVASNLSHSEIEKLVDETRRSAHNAAQLIQLVFPNYSAVILQLLQRLARVKIKYLVTKILLERKPTLEASEDEAKSKEYLETLVFLYKQVVHLMKELSVYNIKNQLDFSQLIDDVFFEYRRDESYMLQEKSFLVWRFTELLSDFSKFRTQRKLMKSQKSKIDNVNTVDMNILSVLTLETAISILYAHQVSVERCREISIPSELTSNILKLFDILVAYFGLQYVEVSLEMMLDDLSQSDSKMEPNLKGIEVVSIVSKMFHLFQKHFITHILPTVSTAASHREAIAKKNQVYLEVEEKLNSILQTTIEMVIGWLEKMLAKQKKTDYRPKDVKLGMTNPTQVCEQCCAYVTSVYQLVSHSLDGKNKQTFLLEIGCFFHGLLLEHMKKFIISTTGALILSHDLARYQLCFSQFGITEIDKRFELLKHIGNIYIVRGENVLELVESDEILSRIDPMEMKELTSLRENFKNEKIFSGSQAQQRTTLTNRDRSGSGNNNISGNHDMVTFREQRERLWKDV